ncbi:F/Y-rich N-terminus-domain-containing protein [Polychytrium aggregatum]|uniref:F/Y-rich N-terminus-domain-containing protein n=1 Tax=Polychytrium aggregatum TaxID=110093 RepID=UPI0022FF059F|nr:F/Y-rich N-terminus-domain-containing protein [Polychytrium aggregatum]KAI9207826.1 F/Y-rich N-terminus-domain-containing protein [Polychytrium aggregatum]
MISPSIPTPENTRRPKKTTQKRAPVTTKLRKIQEIPVGEDGQPVLPMQIGIMTLHSLGAVVTDRENFHSERYIYPVGYCVSRQYASMIDPERSVIYTSRVLDGGDGPRFHVVAEDMPDKPIVANSATGAWTTIIKNANQLRNREHSNSASGPDYFGFSQPSIAKMIQDLPGADLCKSYVHQEVRYQHLRSWLPLASLGCIGL